jgi:hypothetical protein
MKGTKGTVVRPAWTALAATALTLAFSSGVEAGDASLCTSGFTSKSEKVVDGIELISESCDKPLYKAFIARVSLTSKNYEITTTPPKMFFKDVGEFGKLMNAYVATNGGFYGLGHGGWFMNEGKEKGKFVDNEYTSVMGIGRNEGGKIRVEIFKPSHVMPKGGGGQDWMEHGLTGIPVMIWEGKILSSLPPDDFKPFKGGPIDPEKASTKMWQSLHPRTGVGLTKDGKEMIMIVVDGRQSKWSKGMKISQFARLFEAHGAWNALNLDGGCSSAMYVRTKTGLASSPCITKGKDSARKVATHLAVVPIKKSKVQSKLSFLFSPFRRLAAALLG